MEADAGTPFDLTPYLKLFIDKDGRWFQNGVEIIHSGIYKLFNSLLEKTPDGRYLVRKGRETCEVEVEDAPFVVLGLNERSDHWLYIDLNDGSNEPLDATHFWIGTKNIPYCVVKNGKFHARFSRPAYYQLTSYLVEDKNEFFLLLDGKHFPIKFVVPD